MKKLQICETLETSLNAMTQLVTSLDSEFRKIQKGDSRFSDMEDQLILAVEAIVALKIALSALSSANVVNSPPWD